VTEPTRQPPLPAFGLTFVYGEDQPDETDWYDGLDLEAERVWDRQPMWDAPVERTARPTPPSGPVASPAALLVEFPAAGSGWISLLEPAHGQSVPVIRAVRVAPPRRRVRIPGWVIGFSLLAAVVFGALSSASNYVGAHLIPAEPSVSEPAVPGSLQPAAPSSAAVPTTVVPPVPAVPAP
jgi:hypothetical protein